MWKNQWRLDHHQLSLEDSVTTFIRGTRRDQLIERSDDAKPIFSGKKISIWKNVKIFPKKIVEEQASTSPAEVVEGVEAEDVGVVLLEDLDLDHIFLRGRPSHAENDGPVHFSRFNVLSFKLDHVDLVGQIVADDC